MTFPGWKQRLYATALMLGAGLLLFRTISMIVGGALESQVAWVAVLLVGELLVDAACLAASLRWWITGSTGTAVSALRLGAAAALLHAVRVLIFVVGRVGPWIDFDLRPEYRAPPHGGSVSGWVYFAAVMAITGVAGVIVIWTLRRRARVRSEKEPHRDRVGEE